MFCKHSTFSPHHALLLTFSLDQSPIRTVTLEPQPSEYNKLKGKDVPEHVVNFGKAFGAKIQGGVGAVTETV